MTARRKPETLEPAFFYIAADVARLVFGRSAAWFYTNRPKLTRVDGFPQPLCSIGQGRWSGTALLDWIHREIPSPDDQDAPFVPTPGSNVVGIDALLKSRLEAVAGKRRNTKD